MVVPLFHRHRILTQVAADNVNIIKLLPPSSAARKRSTISSAALDDVLQDADSGSGLLLEFGRTMARGTLRRTGKARPGAPYVPPSANGNGNGSRHGSPSRPPWVRADSGPPRT